MPQARVIEIPGVGEVEFPATMSDAEINAAAKRLHGGQGDSRMAGPVPQSVLDAARRQSAAYAARGARQAPPGIDPALIAGGFGHEAGMVPERMTAGDFPVMRGVPEVFRGIKQAAVGPDRLAGGSRIIRGLGEAALPALPVAAVAAPMATAGAIGAGAIAHPAASAYARLLGASKSGQEFAGDVATIPAALLGARGGAAGGRLAARGGQRIAGRLQESLLKPAAPEQLIAGVEEPIGQVIAREKLSAGTGAGYLEKLTKRADEIGAAIRDRLQQPDAQTYRHNIRDAVEGPIRAAISEAEAVGAKGRVAELKSLRSGLTDKMLPDAGISNYRATPLQAFEIKTKLADSTRFKGQAEVEQAINAVKREIVGNLRDLNNARFPEAIPDLNQRYFALKSAIDSFPRELGKQRKADFGSWKSLRSALGETAIKTNLSRILSSSARPIPEATAAPFQPRGLLTEGRGEGLPPAPDPSSVRGVPGEFVIPETLRRRLERARLEGPKEPRVLTTPAPASTPKQLLPGPPVPVPKPMGRPPYGRPMPPVADPSSVRGVPAEFQPNLRAIETRHATMQLWKEFGRWPTPAEIKARVALLRQSNP